MPEGIFEIGLVVPVALGDLGGGEVVGEGFGGGELGVIGFGVVGGNADGFAEEGDVGGEHCLCRFSHTGLSEVFFSY